MSGDDTVPVDIRLLDIERTSIGRVRAYAAVEIEVAGICFVLQGITITQTRNELSADLPGFVRDGRRFPTFCLPEELVAPIGKLVLAAFREMMAPPSLIRGRSSSPGIAFGPRCGT